MTLDTKMTATTMTERRDQPLKQLKAVNYGHIKISHSGHFAHTPML
jgi:hypothetical protein